MNEADHNPAMRRQPRQARGQQRVAQILDAAELLFAEQGYEGATTNAIAAHAGVPIGSIYQFFPNKEAILHGMVARYRAEAAALLDATLAADLPLGDLIDRLLNTVVEFGAQRIGFTRMVLQTGGQPQLAAAAANLQADLAARVEGLLASRAPHLSPERRRLTAEVALRAVLALLAFAIGEKPHGHERVLAIIDEIRRLLGAYIDAAVRSQPPTDFDHPH